MPRTALFRKAFALRELKLATDETAAESAGTFTGYLAVFNNVDLGDDVIEQGAFAKTLNDARERKSAQGGAYLFPILAQHDSAAPCGGFMEAREDNYGLWVKGQLDLDTQIGREVYSGLKKGYLSGMSIGYNTIKYKWVGDVRHLQELALLEGSVVTFPMNPEAQVGAVKAEDAEDKAASQADKDAQEARSKKYGIGIKDGGAVTKPSAWSDLSDADFGDPVNYSYPMPDKEHADNAAARFMAPDALAVYTAKEQGIVAKRIMAKQKSYDETPDWWPPKDDGKGANVTRQAQHQTQHQTQQRQAPPQSGKAARNFDTIFQGLVAGDQLQDDWGDTFIAFVNCMSELMWQAHSQANGWMPEGAPTVDIAEAAQANLDAFSNAVMSLVTRSLAADFAPCMDDDGDQFLDPDGVNGEGKYDSYGTMSATAARRQATKAGRVLSADNHAMMTKALGMIGAGHKMMSEFVKSNAPDADAADAADAHASAGNPNPTNPGDEPPSDSDNVYDPEFGFGKSAGGSGSSSGSSSGASPYAHRAGALAAWRPALTVASSTPAGQHGAGSASEGPDAGKAAATTPSGRTSAAPANDTDELAEYRALLAQMKAHLAPLTPAVPAAVAQ